MKKQMVNETEIAELIKKLQEQVASLERKVDTLISRPSLGVASAQVKPFHKPFQPPVNTPAQNWPRPQDGFRGRVLYKVICADCKKECEIPFKPIGDRSVYCKECFTLRRAANASKPNSTAAPTQALAAPAAGLNSPSASEPQKPPQKQRPVSKKKPVEKKKPVAKKKPSAKKAKKK
jgi:CxxC-x17-CxxC domain-containing protein